jgi:hypothetical protein
VKLHNRAVIRITIQNSNGIRLMMNDFGPHMAQVSEKDEVEVIE